MIGVTACYGILSKLRQLGMLYFEWINLVTKNIDTLRYINKDIHKEFF